MTRGMDGQNKNIDFPILGRKDNLDYGGVIGLAEGWLV